MTSHKNKLKMICLLYCVTFLILLIHYNFHRMCFIVALFVWEQMAVRNEYLIIINLSVEDFLIYDQELYKQIYVILVCYFYLSNIHISIRTCLAVAVSIYRYLGVILLLILFSVRTIITTSQKRNTTRWLLFITDLKKRRRLSIRLYV